MSSNPNTSNADTRATPSFAGLPLEAKLLEEFMRELATSAQQATAPLDFAKSVLASLAKNRPAGTDT